MDDPICLQFFLKQFYLPVAARLGDSMDKTMIFMDDPTARRKFVAGFCLRRRWSHTECPVAGHLLDSSGAGVEGSQVDQRGSFLAAVAAGPVCRFLGGKCLDTPGDHLADPMPPVVTVPASGEPAGRQHAADTPTSRIGRRSCSGRSVISAA